jgi:hypothetical protein
LQVWLLQKSLLDRSVNLVLMENQLVGQLARLPDGQRVRVETVYEDGYARVRRIDGDWAGQIAVCAVSKLGSVGDELHEFVESE